LTEVLIDVRTAEEYSTGAIKGSLHIPHQEVLAEIDKISGLGKDTEILLYCRSGRRSGIAAKALLEAGYVHVLDLGSLEQATQSLSQREGHKGLELSTTYT
jgi:phage shock protein E